jgi:peroxisomal 2,4-dienoyl-CoA reductase
MGRKVPKLEAACSLLRTQGVQEVFYVQGDVRHEQEGEKVIEKVLKHFGKLDILVNNAAGNFLCLLEDLSFNAWKTVIDIDLNGTAAVLFFVCFFFKGMFLKCFALFFGFYF